MSLPYAIVSMPESITSLEPGPETCLRIMETMFSGSMLLTFPLDTRLKQYEHSERQPWAMGTMRSFLETSFQQSMPCRSSRPRKESSCEKSFGLNI